MSSPKLSLSLLLAASTLLALAPALWAGHGAVKPVPQLEPQRFAGTWYQVARLPNSLQSECASDATTHYALQPDGSLDVTQRCLTPLGRVETEQGRAWPAHEPRAGKGKHRAARPDGALKLSYLPRWLQWMPAAQDDHWVVMLDPDYRYAVVSEPTRHHLWVLSRLPTLPADQFGRIVDRLAAEGYPTGQLLLTPQSAPARGAGASPA